MLDEKMKKRLDQTIVNLIQDVAKVQLNPNDKYIILEICAEDDQMNDLELPSVRMKLK